MSYKSRVINVIVICDGIEANDCFIINSQQEEKEKIAAAEARFAQHIQNYSDHDFRFNNLNDQTIDDLIGDGYAKVFNHGLVAEIYLSWAEVN